MTLEKKTVEAFLFRHQNKFPFPIEEILHIEELGRGAFNINYLITTKCKKLVFRFILWPHRLEVSSMMGYEYDVLKYIHPLHISPCVYAKDDSREIFPYPTIVEEYLQGVPSGKISDSSRENLLKVSLLCVDVLKKVHNYDYPNKGGLLHQENFISLKRFENRLKYLEMRSPEIYMLFQKSWGTLEKYLDHCNSVLCKRTIIHGDPFLENFLVAESGIKLVDWQAPLYADKAIDLALFTWDFGWAFYGQTLSQDEKNTIVSHYYSDLSDSLKRETEKIITVLPFLYLNMLLEIEYRFFLIQDQAFIKNISREDRQFILDQRIGLARKILVNIPELQKWLKEAGNVLISGNETSPGPNDSNDRKS